MSKKQKNSIILVVVLLVASLGALIYYANTNKAMPYDVQAEYKGITNNIKNGEEIETEKSKDIELEERILKGKEIELQKPKDKIAIDVLKDTSNATVDDTLETLPDAPLFYRVDGIEINLKENPEIIEGPIKKLTEEDIKRIQGCGYDWHTGYIDKVPPNIKCGEYYEKHPEDAEAVIRKYIPQRLDIFKNAIVGWVTGPNLVYRTAKGYYGIRGVLQLSYVGEDNMFNLEPYKLYERDAEFRYANTTDGLFLRQVIFLSDWREIETWENPYK